METKYITSKELIEHYRIHRNTLENWVKRGCPSRKVGKNRRFIISEVDKWLNTWK